MSSVHDFDNDAIFGKNLQAMTTSPLAPSGSPSYEEISGLAMAAVKENKSVEWAIREALDRWCAPPLTPIPVAERLPEPGIKVLAHYFNACGKSRTVCAIWIPAKFCRDDMEIDNDDFLEYDEEDDKYYWPEGWYEEIDNWDELQSVAINEGVVDYWQPLPHWAIPLPEESK